jgi:hypothetical protein
MATDNPFALLALNVGRPPRSSIAFQRKLDNVIETLVGESQGRIIAHVGGFYTIQVDPTYEGLVTAVKGTIRIQKEEFPEQMIRVGIVGHQIFHRPDYLARASSRSLRRAREMVQASSGHLLSPLASVTDLNELAKPGQIVFTDDVAPLLEGTLRGSLISPQRIHGFANRITLHKASLTGSREFEHVTINLDRLVENITENRVKGEADSRNMAGSETRRTDPPGSAPAYPAIEVPDEHPASGGELTITVKLANLPDPKTAGKVNLPDDDPTTVYNIGVHLLFAGISKWSELKFSREKETTVPAVFKVTIPELPIAKDGSKPERRVEPIVVNFYFNCRWCGEACRNIEIRRDSSIAAKEIKIPEASLWRQFLNVAPTAQPPDLLVRIQIDTFGPVTTPKTTRYLWTCLSPHVSVEAASLEDRRSVVQDGAEKYVTRLFEPLANKTLGALDIRSVFGAGEKIYDKLAPKSFKDIYWRLFREAVAEPRRFEFDSIQFVTDEPYIPWELMRLTAPDGQASVEPELLAIRHSVGRWVAERSCLLRQNIAVDRFAVFATDYKTVKGVEPKLPWAKEEGEHLHERFGAEILAVQEDVVIDFLEKNPGQAVHFACHGQMDALNPERSLLYLEDNQTSFTPLVLGTEEVRNCIGHEHPFVFLNACQLGGAGSTFSLVAGWPAAFLGAGAGALVAPLWSVGDAVAKAVSQEFYDNAFKADGEPLGAILKKIRQKWKDSKRLTYLAYVLYGDPMARITFRRSASESGGNIAVTGVIR